jgi:hypothetical protein
MGSQKQAKWHKEKKDSQNGKWKSDSGNGNVEERRFSAA